ncbi:FKBP-type peptidyl-prolyl cis-trans isomerase [Microbacterium sp. Marseille-Q6965]|uniref:FKBP-type peptidyl-prolyl cis-trans isomerase n=1 Tax=Microbacterium sp. Marseille-Q6965 TaxID=2965072 RepID=UPI0021B716DE|nr:FKBP-type peptidyl-prolyl cis-trans isomerase [Microbacterium sp. Marseille-Q6965]
MRRRSAVLLSTAALAALALAGCSSPAEPDAEPTGTPADLCAAAADSGPVVESLSVSDASLDEGTVTVDFDTPLEVTDFERQVVVEGTGEPIESGQFLDVALTAYNAETGELYGTAGYQPGEQLPQQISPESTLGLVLGCAPIGSRIAAVFPASDASPTALVYTFDILGVTPTAAWGEPQEPVEGMPTVELDDDGAPTVTLPDDLAIPETTQLATLKQGDGVEVQDGDQVLVQYRGVRASTGEEFDSSWSGGTPAQFGTDQVIPGFTKALVGHTVGSQVIAVIPPAEGYGEGEINEEDLTGETLIFVVDILATQHAAAAPAE